MPSMSRATSSLRPRSIKWSGSIRVRCLICLSRRSRAIMSCLWLGCSRYNGTMTNPLDGEIRDGRHHQAVRVYYEDTDFSGIVYHASYLRFMERGRTNHLRLIGADHRVLFEQAEKEAPGFAFVVRHMSVDFKKPAHMDD